MAASWSRRQGVNMYSGKPNDARPWAKQGSAPRAPAHQAGLASSAPLLYLSLRHALPTACAVPTSHRGGVAPSRGAASVSGPSRHLLVSTVLPNSIPVRLSLDVPAAVPRIHTSCDVPSIGLKRSRRGRMADGLVTLTRCRPTRTRSSE